MYLSRLSVCLSACLCLSVCVSVCLSSRLSGRPSDLHLTQITLHCSGDTSVMQIPRWLADGHSAGHQMVPAEGRQCRTWPGRGPLQIGPEVS